MNELTLFKNRIYTLFNTCFYCCLHIKLHTNMNLNEFRESAQYIKDDIDIGHTKKNDEKNENDPHKNEHDNEDEKNMNLIDTSNNPLNDSICFTCTFVKYTNTFNINDVEATINDYSVLFEPIMELKVGDKLSIYDNKIYISSNSWVQSMERWYYSQSRQQSMEYIKQLFYEYNDYINRLLIYYNENEPSIDKLLLRRYNTILKNILDVNVKLITSLIELTQTYKNDTLVTNVYNTIYTDLILRNTTIITKLY